MSAVLRLDPRKLPATFVPRVPLTGEEFAALCRDSDSIQLERTREGDIRMNPPAGGFTGDGNASLTQQLRNWWDGCVRGRVFDSSTGFRLPDSSTLSPDAAYLSAEQVAKLGRADLRGFPPACPAFVIELFSETDLLHEAKAKMERWVENGAKLAWLIDPYAREVWVYRPGQQPRAAAGREIRGTGPVEGFALDLEKLWRCYEL